ncbi:MAG: hypothetical protein C0494_17635 [Sphingobium sp.]|nr:hypothetical protein [Sphingobium sp.]
MDKLFAAVFEVATIVGSLVGGLLVIWSLAPSNSAPQAAALAASGIGLAVVPYCLAGVLHRAIMRKSVQPPRTR